MTDHTTEPGQDPDQGVEAPPTEGTESGASRRIFLAGAGVSALGAAAIAAAVTAAPAAAQTEGAAGADGPGTAGEAVVAYVSDGARGEITMFRGSHEVVVQDHGLALTLANRFDQALARATNQEH